jgi:HAD superfamily hydrolase (TIGR01490 family)
LKSPVAAFFDVDGTLTKTTILDPLIWYQCAHLSRLRFLLWAAGLIVQAPQYWLIDRRSRSQFNRVFYRRYAGLSAADLRAWHRRTFSGNLQRRLFPAGLDCVREHQRQGHRIVLVTGALDFVMQPLAEFVQADDLLAIQLQECDGIFTGELNSSPIADEHKALLLRAHAQQHGIDLAQSFAYGNSLGDAPMLACVGHAVAVNPDRRLKALASEHGWRVVEWRLL